MSDYEQEIETKEEEINDIRSPDVVTKYRAAGDIANEALQAVIAAVKPGAKIVDLCQLGDDLINERLSKIYNKGKGKVDKGIGFPTCVSVNQIVGHFSPLKDNESTIKANDVVKVDLGVHIDGYCAVVADSVVATEEVEAEFTGKVADLFHAINTAMEAALRLVKVGAKNTAVTEAFEKIAESYGVNMIQGVLSHDMKKFLIDGNRVILSKTDSETKVDEFDFELNEVFALDIVMSTGDGKPREVDEKTTVYKRNPDVNYKLKMKASNYVLGEINHRFPAFPFSLRHLDEKKGRLGILELLNHGLVNDYPVLLEKDGEFVAHFKATLLLLPSGTLRITGKPIDLARFKTEKSIEDENLKALLSQDLKSKKKKNKKKKPAKAADEDNAE